MLIATMTIMVVVSRYVMVTVTMTIAGWQQYLDAAVPSWTGW